MHKLFLLSICLLAAGFAEAATVSGEVIKAKRGSIVVQTEDGDKMTFHTTDGTTYRQKKVHRKGRMHKGKMMPADAYYEPMVEEDDWVEITYTPATNDMQTAEVQEVVVYDD